MKIHLTEADHLLLDRYLDCVLLRHAEGVYNLETARAELAQAFTQMTREEPAFRNHMQAILDAGDDA